VAAALHRRQTVPRRPQGPCAGRGSRTAARLGEVVTAAGNRLRSRVPLPPVVSIWPAQMAISVL